MTFNYSLYLSMPELRAMAKMQDSIESSVSTVANALNISVPEVPVSNWNKLQIALGATKTVNETIEVSGGEIEYVLRINKKGISISMEINIREKNLVEAMKLYADLVNMYIPVITSAIAGFIAANALAEKRVEAYTKSC